MTSKVIAQRSGGDYDAGVDRVVFGVPPEAKDKVLPVSTSA